jgi:hypothetical protein
MYTTEECFACHQFNQILFSVILVIVRELHTPSASPNEQSLWKLVVWGHVGKAKNFPNLSIISYDK